MLGLAKAVLPVAVHGLAHRLQAVVVSQRPAEKGAEIGVARGDQDRDGLCHACLVLHSLIVRERRLEVPCRESSSAGSKVPCFRPTVTLWPNRVLSPVANYAGP